MASASDNGEPTISLQEYVESQKDQEEAANAVLGNSDPTNCSFSKGYMKRQPLYSCATCYNRDLGYAGICLACSLECHDGHELFELYTKRKFRCDCGNSKMMTQCKLESNKSDTQNTDNRYDSNFDGLYCTCKRPYPDTEAENEEEMIQCCVCEDWLHSVHLNLTSDIPTEYDEMICYLCIQKYPLLQNYSLSNTEIKTETAVSAETQSTTSVKSEASDLKTDSTDGKPEQKLKSDLESENAGCKSKTEETNLKVEPEIKDNETTIKLACKKPQVNITTLSTSFYEDGWRNLLCICEDCQTAMKDINFLYDNEDTVRYYESQNVANPQSLHDQGMNALSSLNRPQMIEMVRGYTDMKTELSDYLQQFADDKKVISKEDIQQFFEEFTQNKRRRLHLPPNNCK